MRRWLTIAAAVAGAHAACGHIAGAQQLVQGRVVVGGSRAPIPGLSVRLLRVAPADTVPLPADTTALAAGRTASDGVFSLLAPDTGSYRARIGDGFVGPVMHLVSADTLVAQEYQLRLGEARALRDVDVEKQAGLNGGLATRYPSELQALGTGGRVIAQFVVDTTGRAEPATFRALVTTHPLFTEAVRAAVMRARFFPAEIGHHPVRQLVEIPVNFAISDPLVRPPSALEDPFPPVRVPGFGFPRRP